MEPGYTLINYLFKELSLEYYYVLAFVSLITNILFYNQIKKTFFPFISLLLFLRFTYLQTEFMFVRQGISIGLAYFSLAAFNNGAKKKFILLFITAVLFHLSVLIFIPFLALIKKKYKIQTYILILLTSLIFVFYDFTNIINYIPIDFIKNKSLSYVENDIWNKSSEFGFSVIERILIISSLFYLITNYANKLPLKFYFYFNIYFIGNIIYILFFKNYIFAERFSVIFNYSLIFIFPYLYFYLDDFSKKIIKNLISFFVLIYLLKTLYLSESTLLPYKTFL
jgi:hypothetical protein